MRGARSGSIVAKLHVILLGVVACSSETVEPEPDPCDMAQSIRATSAFTTVAEEADIAARALPGGFGGLYQEFGASSDGIMVAFFKDTSFPAIRKADLRKLLLCRGAYPEWSGVFLTTDLSQIEIRQGQYTGTELLEYLGQLESLKNDASVWGIEVDPEQNKVWIGLEDAAQRGRIEQLAAAQGVPSGALAIEGPPPVTGSEQFESLSPLIETDLIEEFPGAFGFFLMVRFTNRQASVRYPEWCADGGARFFRYTLQKWNGTEWKMVKATVCDLIFFPPRPVGPGESVTDSIPVAAGRRLHAFPPWLSARITGTYRLVGAVYTDTTSGPAGLTVVTNPAPLEEQVSVPFRVLNRGNY